MLVTQLLQDFSALFAAGNRMIHNHSNLKREDTHSETLNIPSTFGEGEGIQKALLSRVGSGLSVKKELLKTRPQS